jgi:uncharacterized protein DUF4440
LPITDLGALVRLLHPPSVILAVALATGCRAADAARVTEAQRLAITDTLTRLITNAYDFSKRDSVVPRLMSLYPDSGPLVSAGSGRLITSRDSLEAVIRRFWESTGQNMRDPRWEWGEMHVDVLAPDAAVMSATYRVPHLTPAGVPHVIGGAWTAVFVRRNGRWMILQEHLSDLPGA